jgi:tRNA 2-thiouridine synthesizing protein D
MSAKPIFSLFVSKSPYDSRNAESAITFCHAAIQSGYVIKQVFFYQSGVQNGSDYLSVNTDEVSVKSRWSELHHTHNVPLYICVTAATRRGILYDDVSKGGKSNLASDFEAVGMSEYFAALHDTSVKGIQF